MLLSDYGPTVAVKESLPPGAGQSVRGPAIGS